MKKYLEILAPMLTMELYGKIVEVKVKVKVLGSFD